MPNGNKHPFLTYLCRKNLLNSMSMDLKERNSVRVLLFNQEGALLLMHADDPRTTTLEGTYLGPFWFPIGGGIESGESVQQAALREVNEETGLAPEDIELGPVVWQGAYDFILSGVPTHAKQLFIVAKTDKNAVTLSQLTTEEKKIIKKIAWFTWEQIKNSKEIIYPIGLAELIAPLIAGNYPAEPLEIDLYK